MKCLLFQAYYTSFLLRKSGMLVFIYIFLVKTKIRSFALRNTDDVIFEANRSFYCHFVGKHCYSGNCVKVFHVKSGEKQLMLILG